MATPAEQACQALQVELTATRAHLAQLATSHDTLRTAHDALNAASHRLFGERQLEIKASEDKLRNLIFTQKFDLIDLKEITPDKFRGRKTDNFKPWAKKLKAYCNAKRIGFKGALEWAEKETSEIQDATGSGWSEAAAADARLYDFLCNLLEEDALLLIDQPHLDGRGFESWRLLVTRFNPSGGAYELDAMMSLMALQPVKDLASLPGAVARFERDFRAYERRSGKAFPEEWKVPAFLRLLPKSHAADLRWKFANGTTGYNELQSSIINFAQHQRFEGSFGRGDNDMQCDALQRDAPWH